MNAPLILLVEDSPADAFMFISMIRKVGMPVDVLHAETMGDARDLRRRVSGFGRSFASVIIDERLPDGSGSDLEREIRTSPEWVSARGMRPIIHRLTGDQRTLDSVPYALDKNCVDVTSFRPIVQSAYDHAAMVQSFVMLVGAARAAGAV